MADTPPDGRTDESTPGRLATPPAVGTSTYKVLGEFADAGGAGVLGRNDAASGTPIGVRGAVPNASGGYGLFTDDDARVGGTLGTAAIDTAGSDFTVEAGTTATGDAGNVVHGHASNQVTDGAVGATVAGGGTDDGSTATPNEVFDDYGTIGGGRDNQAGNNDTDPTTARFATVGGGDSNTASDGGATVAGGIDNTASGIRATVAGGSTNEASGRDATIGGGSDNTASSTRATIGGGILNDAGGNDSTVGGGVDNTASSTLATVGGGRSNAASDDYAAVGGGWNNDAGARFAAIAGGGPADTGNPGTTNNAVYDDYGTVGGGGNNQAGTDDGDPSTARFATVGGGERNTVSATRATVGGGYFNTASDRVATVAGGRSNTASATRAIVGGGFNNTASATATTVGGGEDNTASGVRATVAGGRMNVADGTEATVGGGGNNDAHANYDTIGGGVANRTGTSGTTADLYATVGGGRENTASDGYATVPGGQNNVADGIFSFAAGRRAKATHDGTFVWADSTDADFASTGADQVLVRASGGVGIGTDAPSTQLDVDGAISASKTGASVVLSTYQTIPGGSSEVVVFDSVNVDHFGGYDTSTGEYTIQEAGDYHLSVIIDWRDTFSGDKVYYIIHINGNTLMAFDVTVDGAEAQAIDRTLFDLSSGDTIEVRVEQLSGSDKDLEGSSDTEQTVMTIHKVG